MRTLQTNKSHPSSDNLISKVDQEHVLIFHSCLGEGGLTGSFQCSAYTQADKKQLTGELSSRKAYKYKGNIAYRMDLVMTLAITNYYSENILATMILKSPIWSGELSKRILIRLYVMAFS